MGAAGIARPKVDALVATLVWLADDGDVRWPPVPTKLVKTGAHDFAHLAEGNRWQWRLFVGIGGITNETGDAYDTVILRVVGFQLRIIYGPVIGNAVEGSDAKVGRVKTGEVSGVENGPATNRIEIRHRNGRVLGVVDGIICITVAVVWADCHFRVAQHFPFAPRAGIL